LQRCRGHPPPPGPGGHGPRRGRAPFPYPPLFRSLRVATAAGAAMLARLGWGAVTGAGRETVAAAGAAAGARAGAAGNGAGRAAEIGRAHVRTPVTRESRMPSSA